jgi:hypothetical protein
MGSEFAKREYRSEVQPKRKADPQPSEEPQAIPQRPGRGVNILARLSAYPSRSSSPEESSQWSTPSDASLSPQQRRFPGQPLHLAQDSSSVQVDPKTGTIVIRGVRLAAQSGLREFIIKMA